MLGFCMQAQQRSRGAMLAAMDVDDTLVLILEQIDSPICLIRAASTCRRWRRLIADAGFLRRFRSLHGPPVAGVYYNDGKQDARGKSPSFVPSSSSIDARHFSLGFVIDVPVFERLSRSDVNPSWKVRDSRGSLLLMDCIPEPFLSGPFPHLVVCEPLTRRYRIIPRPPHFNLAHCDCQGGYLVDGDEEDEAGGRIGMSNFRVLFVVVSYEDEVAGVAAYTTMFTAGSGDTDSTWSEKAAIDQIGLRLVRQVNPDVRSFYLGRALGSSYTYIQQDRTVITRDGSTGKFSSSVLPLSLDVKSYWDGHNRRWAQNSFVVDGGDGEPRIVTMTNHTMEVFTRVDGQWRLEHKVLLSKVTRGLPGYRASLFDKPMTVVRRGVGFVVISPWEPKQPQWPFSVDLRTLEVAPATKGSWERMSYPCEFPWPPVLQVCLDR